MPFIGAKNGFFNDAKTDFIRAKLNIPISPEMSVSCH